MLQEDKQYFVPATFLEFGPSFVHDTLSAMHCKGRLLALATYITKA